MEESKELTTEIDSLNSSAEPESEASPSLSFLFEHGYMHEKNQLIEGIKCFMSMSKMLKMKERENCLLRNQIEALKSDKEAGNKKVDTHKFLENQKLLEAVIEELKNRLEILLKNHEIMQSRLEELEFQKMHIETNAVKMQKTIDNLKSSFGHSNLKDTNEKQSREKGSKTEAPGKMKEPEDLSSSVKNMSVIDKEEGQPRMKNAEDMAQTEMKSSICLKPLPSGTVQSPTDNGDLKTDSPTSLLSNPNIKSTNENSQVEMGIKKLIELMDGLSQNKRISTLQSEPPVIYQNSEIFVRITDILKKILAGKQVPYRSVQSFWDFLINQANIVEKVIKEKTNEVQRVSGDELNRMEQVHAEEKEKIVKELREMEELAQERSFLLTELTDKHINELKDKDGMIQLLDRENSNLQKEIAEYKVALAASLQASRNRQAAQMMPKISEPSVVQCDHEDYRQQLEDLKMSSRQTEKDLKHKLILATKKLDLEKQKNQMNMASKSDSQPETIIEAVPLKASKNPRTHCFTPRVYAYANAGREKVGMDADKKDEYFETFSPRDAPEDKDWLIAKFLKPGSTDS